MHHANDTPKDLYEFYDAAVRSRQEQREEREQSHCKNVSHIRIEIDIDRLLNRVCIYDSSAAAVVASKWIRFNICFSRWSEKRFYLWHLCVKRSNPHTHTLRWEWTLTAFVAIATESDGSYGRASDDIPSCLWNMIVNYHWHDKSNEDHTKIIIQSS